MDSVRGRQIALGDLPEQFMHLEAIRGRGRVRVRVRVRLGRPPRAVHAPRGMAWNPEPSALTLTLSLTLSLTLDP